MAEVSTRFSLREVVGTVAPGAMVLLAVVYVVSRLPGVGGVSRIESGWSALLILFVVSYGVGTLLTSLTEAVFAAVTKLDTSSLFATDVVTRPPTTTAERLYQGVDRFVKLAVGYLGGGQDITTGIREFRESWHERAVPEGVISGHSMALARRHYEALFDTEPKGEEALFVCEYYARVKIVLLAFVIACRLTRQADAVQASAMTAVV